jgi:hypothetical protein
MRTRASGKFPGFVAGNQESAPGPLERVIVTVVGDENVFANVRYEFFHNNKDAGSDAQKSPPPLSGSSAGDSS